MKFTVIWDKKAREFLRKQDKHISSRIVKKVDKIREDPIKYIEPLVSVKSYKLRVEDYRVIMDVDWEKKILFILLIDHRKRIYKRLK